MVPLGSEGYWLVRLLFERGLAVIYLFAFIVALKQFRPLAGEDGLLPIDEYAEGVEFGERPSLFQLLPDDRFIGAAAWTGVVLSSLALVGVPYWLPEPYPVVASMALWGAMWALYLSFVNAGRVFYGYGWESMLLETGFLAIFLGAGETAPPTVVLLLISWVLFRNMFGAGLIKIRGDDCWRELRCMDYHYETQPIPNPLSWFAHRLPDRFHRVEVLGNHVVELAIPFLYFAPQPYATVGGVATIGFQLWLMTTGNFAWLNALTIVQATATFGDGTLSVLPGVSAPAAAPTPLYLEALALLVAAVILVLSVPPTRNMLSPGQVMNTSFDPIHLVKSYGAFGSVTRERYQLVIEGTREPNPGEDDWEAYDLKGQPVDPAERPPQWAPYHLRLDWQLWFAAMRSRPGPRQRWLLALLAKLLEGDRETESLLAATPFEESPERIRVLRYRYRFTTREERTETGRWWSRERVGTYVPASTREELGSSRRIRLR
ncbi:lipase maturation factor family protein [Saliphagus infecundisoli]|uniref:Lipase maturation factor family protein n=1 Tax=Saliphagus infecundisoli TaxID=1849069 RepID=A0ABD5QBN7_9EURY|nr:lipase maturation factor family protein [Saliphagus infecundisoli]